MRSTARQRALPALIVENNRRLEAIEACSEGDWSAIEDACAWLAQNLRHDCQPRWDLYPLGTRRYDRLRFQRKDQP